MNYKKLEEEHYDSRYFSDSEYLYPDENEMSINDKVNIPSRRYIEQRTNEIIKKIVKVNLLDYGCAIGEKSYKFSSPDVRITGIDISKKSIEIASKLASKHLVNGQYLIMDCECLSFENKMFDIVYDFGTFSSIDVKKALPEICRVLKDDGYLITIETLGNNPIMYLKRKLNVLKGSRTQWASNHIMKLSDWDEFRKYFYEFEIRYFSFLTLFLSPILYILPYQKHFSIISFFAKIDDLLLRIKFFQYFAFKAVAIMSKPKRDNLDSVW